jgi:diketogulonate reductase-like aldo/keto reductase
MQTVQEIFDSDLGRFLPVWRVNPLEKAMLLRIYYAFLNLCAVELMLSYAASAQELRGRSCENHGNTSIPIKKIGSDIHGWPVCMPLLGAGTWQYNDTIAYESLCKAFNAGISFVDTAFGYNNERGVGRAIHDCFQGQRQELFVMTKIPGGLTFQQTLLAHHQNMFALNLEYVDHLMTHFPSDWNLQNASKEMRQQEWRALEEIYYSGKARSIGLSHYCSQHITDILEIATVAPSINQVEYHVGSQDVDRVMEFCRQHNITFMSFSPLCGPCTNYDPLDSLIDGTLVTAIGTKYNVSGSQIALRFIVQQALEHDSVMGGVIPKSNNEELIRSNLNIFSFELTDDDMSLLKKATKPPAEIGDCEVP